MRKHSPKILFIVFVSLGVIGIGLMASANIVHDTASQRRYEKAKPLSVDNIVEAYKAFGVSGETLDKIDGFEKALAEYSSAKNNIVIVGGNGSILYKLNDNFLHLNGDTLNIAIRNMNSVTMDYANSMRHWYLMRDINDVSSGWFSYADMVVIGDIRTPAEDLRYMLDVYDGKGAEANLTICCIREKDGEAYPGSYMPVPTSAPSDANSTDRSQYLLWFRDAAMDTAVSKALGPSYWEFYNYAMNFGGLALALYWLLVPVWVFIDARRRRTQPLPWALLVLLTNLVGLAVYWIYQAQNAKASPACPVCGKAVNKTHMYCPWCSAPLAKECKGCGKAMEREWVTCPWCGKPVE